MLEEIIVAGSGGQGALMLGEVLAIATIYRGQNATWLPSYGPQMRGGTANCSVVLSTEDIASPVVEEPTVAFCLNQPSLNKFGPAVRRGGLVIANDDTIEEYPSLEGVEVVRVQANRLAAEVGNPMVLIMVVLGALLKKRPLVEQEDVVRAMEHVWGEARAKKLVPLNLKAIAAGSAAEE